jgi:hypothetical protein
MRNTVRLELHAADCWLGRAPEAVALGRADILEAPMAYHTNPDWVTKIPEGCSEQLRDFACEQNFPGRGGPSKVWLTSLPATARRAGVRELISFEDLKARARGGCVDREVVLADDVVALGQRAITAFDRDCSQPTTIFATEPHQFQLA